MCVCVCVCVCARAHVCVCVCVHARMCEEVLTEGLIDGEVGLDDEHGCAHDLALLKNVSSSPVQDTIDTTYGHLRALGEEGRGRRMGKRGGRGWGRRGGSM